MRCHWSGLPSRVPLFSSPLKSLRFRSFILSELQAHDMNSGSYLLAEENDDDGKTKSHQTTFPLLPSAVRAIISSVE